jgi:hypothetical protein
MRFRIADCRLRIGKGSIQAHNDLPLSIRNPKSAIRILFFVAACTPITTRPDFLPDPRAREVILMARPERVTTELPTLLAAESLHVEHTNVRDGYLETAWYDTRTRRSHAGAGDVPDLGASVKIRFWADPYVPGQTRLTIEAVYRPRYDPSRTERDLEVVLPKAHAGQAITDSLMGALKKKFGSPDGT